jgi:hypothetical protein
VYGTVMCSIRYHRKRGSSLTICARHCPVGLASLKCHRELQSFDGLPRCDRVNSECMESVLFTILISVATGLAASALFWWLQAKLLRPKVVICPDLRLIKSAKGENSKHSVCEFYAINRGRFAAADISIKATFLVPDFLTHGKDFAFYMRDIVTAWLGPGMDNQYVIGPQHLLHDSEQKEYCARLERKIGKSLRQIDMRELMESCPGSYVTVFMASNHAFSGARSFNHVIYTEKDFLPTGGRCMRAGCCEVTQRWYKLRALATILMTSEAAKTNS